MKKLTSINITTAKSLKHFSKNTLLLEILIGKNFLLLHIERLDLEENYIPLKINSEKMLLTPNAAISL